MNCPFCLSQEGKHVHFVTMTQRQVVKNVQTSPFLPIDTAGNKIYTTITVSDFRCPQGHTWSAD